MKLVLPIVLVSCLLFTSCQESIELHDVWAKKPSFDSLFRTHAVGFAIGGKGYAGLGYVTTIKSDWWEYNPDASTWVKKRDFPGVPRVESFYTADEHHGYMGMGITYSPLALLGDIWQYNAADDKWSALTTAPFKADIRTPASFVIDEKLFITNGQELWAFDLTSKTWLRKNDLPFSMINFHGRENGKTVVISDNVYFFFTDTSLTVPYEFAWSFSVWKYNIELDTWSSVISRLSNPPMDWGSLFVLEDKVYVADWDSHGYQKINILDGSYESTYLADEESFDGLGLVAFAINGSGYVLAPGKGGYWQYIQ